MLISPKKRKCLFTKTNKNNNSNQKQNKKQNKNTKWHADISHVLDASCVREGKKRGNKRRETERHRGRWGRGL